MGPKKKQRLSEGSRASTKPVSTSSTRSRTRSASAAPAASTTTTTTSPASKKGQGKGKAKQTQTSKAAANSKQDALASLSPVWEAESAPKMTCWVDIPPLHPRPTEDELLFVRPRTITELKAKGKQREGALLHHLDRSAGKVDPFHFTDDDLRDESEGRQLFAFQPKPKPPKPRKAAPTPRPAQPAHDGLEDLFLGSHAGPSTTSTQPDQTRPLFFHGESDEEDARRNGPVSPTKPSVSQTKVKAEPTTNGQQPNGQTLKPAQSDNSRSQSASAQPLASSREKKRSRSVERVRDESAGKKRGEDIKNLRSELNEDAFARSTGPRHKEEYRNKLAALSQARKKAKLDRGESLSASDSDRAPTKTQRNGRATSVSSGSDSGSDSDSSSGDSSDSSSSGDFIVGDDQIEYDEGFDPNDAETAPRPLPSAAAAAALPKDGKYKRDSDGRIRLMPIHSHAAVSGSSSSVLAAHGLGLGARKGLDELCLDWLEWAVARVLVTWSSLSPADRERLERNRAALKSRTRSTEESVGSVAMRRQFKWYLTNYPKMHVEALFTDEIDRFGSLAKQGCGICHRRSQKPQARVMFSGARYNQQTLAPLSPDSSSDSDSDASDRSDDTETWREAGRDDKGRTGHVFFAGNHCAHRAAVLHALHHWEWTAMQTLARHESIRYIRRQLWRKSRNGRGKDGCPGAGAYEVAFCITEMISPTGRCTWKSKPDTTRAVSELDRLRRRLKSLTDQAIAVNRAK